MLKKRWNLKGTTSRKPQCPKDLAHGGPKNQLQFSMKSIFRLLFKCSVKYSEKCIFSNDDIEDDIFSKEFC
jgi:hypothetical protein